jgi:Flp pilus assembly protein TadD
VSERYGRAVQVYREAAKLSPNNPVIRAGLGIALVMSDMGFREAIPYLVEAVKSDPQNANAWLALGIAYQNLSRNAEAKGPYQEYLKLVPRGPQSDEVRAALKGIP